MKLSIFPTVFKIRVALFQGFKKWSVGRFLIADLAGEDPKNNHEHSHRSANNIDEVDFFFVRFVFDVFEPRHIIVVVPKLWRAPFRLSIPFFW